MKNRSPSSLIWFGIVFSLPTAYVCVCYSCPITICRHISVLHAFSLCKYKVIKLYVYEKERDRARVSRTIKAHSLVESALTAFFCLYHTYTHTHTQHFVSLDKLIPDKRETTGPFINGISLPTKAG